MRFLCTTNCTEPKSKETEMENAKRKNTNKSFPFRTKRLRKNSARIRNVENSIPKITIFKIVLENFFLCVYIVYTWVYIIVYINGICYRSLGISNIKTNNS